MLLTAVDLIVLLSLAAQFAIAGYFLYLVYWLIELPPADAAVPALPDELPHVLIQIPVYNEPLVVERALVAAAAPVLASSLRRWRWCRPIHSLQ